MGIICTCLPAVHTFVCKILGKRRFKAEINFPAARDPNSDRVDANVVSDSGYHTGATHVSLGTMEVEGQTDESLSVRPMASDKSLLVTTSRCDN